MIRRVLIGVLWVIALGLFVAGCGGSSGSTSGPTDKSTITSNTASDGVTKAPITVTLANATATIPEGTALTTVDGTPVTGTVVALLSYSTNPADLAPAAQALPANTTLLSFLDIELKNTEGRLVKYLSRQMTVNVKTPGVQPGETVMHYSFNGISWVSEEAVTVNADGTVDIVVSHFSYHALLKVASADTTPPTVIFTAPADGATDIFGNAQILAVFSKPMDSSTITTGTFTVAIDGGSAVNGSVFYDSATRSALFKPAAILTPNRKYRATISASVKDMAGNSMASDKIWTFTKWTSLDYVRPTVKATVPSNNASAVPLDEKIVITFSEQMDPSTVTQELVAGLQGTLAYDPVTNCATFTPSSPLTAGATYTITVRDTAKDLAGNLLKPYTWSFTAVSPTGSSGSSGF